MKRGGSLLATFATSLYDEVGRRRDDFGLADVFGVSFDGRIQGPMQNSYLTLETDPSTGRRHPILEGLEDTTAHHQRRVPSRRAADGGLPVAADAHPVVSRPADGGRLPARRAYRRARALSAHHRRQPRRLHPLGHRPHVLGRDVRRPRTAAARTPSAGRPTKRRRSRSRARASSTSPCGGSGTR